MKLFKKVVAILCVLANILISSGAMACTGTTADSFDCLRALGAQTPSEQAEVWRQEQQKINQKEAQRQWQIREDAVQKEIAQLRATPSYGALAVSDIDSSMGGGFGYTTQEKATQHALKACKAGNCRMLVTFFNTCAVVANSMGSKNSKTLIVALDPSPAQALNKALVQCEAKFGSGNCGVHNNGEAFCAGYDYGLYGK